PAKAAALFDLGPYRRSSASQNAASLQPGGLAGFRGFLADSKTSPDHAVPIGPTVRSSMKYNDLLQLYFERSNSLQWYWTIYVVVIGGLLAFSSLRQRPDVRTAVLVTVLYCFFAYKNLGAIRDV